MHDGDRAVRRSQFSRYRKVWNCQIKLCSYPQSKSPRKIDVARTTRIWTERSRGPKNVFFHHYIHMPLSNFKKHWSRDSIERLRNSSTQSHRITERSAIREKLFPSVIQLEQVKESIFHKLSCFQSAFSDTDTR